MLKGSKSHTWGTKLARSPSQLQGINHTQAELESIPESIDQRQRVNGLDHNYDYTAALQTVAVQLAGSAPTGASRFIPAKHPEDGPAWIGWAYSCLGIKRADAGVKEAVNAELEKALVESHNSVLWSSSSKLDSVEVAFSLDGTDIDLLADCPELAWQDGR